MTEGRLGGKNVKTLKLNDDDDIHRLCHGNVTFERPDLAQNLENQRKAAQAPLSRRQSRKSRKRKLWLQKKQLRNHQRKKLIRLSLLSGALIWFYCWLAVSGWQLLSGI